MGFRNGAYATVWEAKSISETHTKLKISISRKDSRTDEYVNDFTGFVDCFGTAVAKKAALLQERSRIKLGECDVSTSYNKEKKIGYTNFKMFSFDDAEFSNNTQSQNTEDPSQSVDVDGGEVDDSNGKLPF